MISKILRKHQILLLAIAQVLFMLRVLGQFMVFHYSPSWLPPMEEWDSGLIVYKCLFPTQILMILFMTKASLDNGLKKGKLYVTKDKTKKILIYISSIYFAIMLTRYVITMLTFPEKRWLVGLIPIFLH